MSLTDRHRWIIGKIQEAFSPELDSETVNAFIRQDINVQRLTAFFRGEGSGRMFVFYQPESEDESWSENPGPKVLSLSDGSAGAMRYKCCYFIRNVPPNVALDLTKCGESDLLYGELGASPLETIEAILSQTYRPMLDTFDNWGKVDDEQKSEFKNEIGAFITNINEALNSFASGLELRAPDPKHHKVFEAGTRRTTVPSEAVDHFEVLLNEWYMQIKSYIAQPNRTDSEDVGPRGELEYWRSQMQKLTSVTEQLKRQDIKQVVLVLQMLTKNTTEVNKSNIVTALRNWKMLDVDITEAANEAKDNVKYLYTLERFIDPLYTGNAETITDTLPALMNSIKMIHTIARYYNTSERMTSLFAKITEQMIANCKVHIIGEESSSDALWETEPQELVRKLESCLKLNESYQEQYRLTKAKLEQTPKGKQFTFDEMQIFGKFDLFCRRVIKLIDMFNTIDQFNSLSKNRLEGMEKLTEQFHTIVHDFRIKHLDLLDYHNNKFDREFVEFGVRITNLEASLRTFIDESFMNINAVDHSLKVLSKFKKVLARETLKSDLDTKLYLIFQNWGNELKVVQAQYERDRNDAPIPRNMPPIAGIITWCRHLQNRILGPMAEFEKETNVLATKEAIRIIKAYNKLMKLLLYLEYSWMLAFVNSIEQYKAGLQATLIIRHPNDEKLYVNFDLEILQLIREAKCLDRMGKMEITDAARIVLFQEEKFKNYHDELHWALSEYERIARKVIPVTSLALKPAVIKDMEYKLRPGMVTLTWTSMNIDAYKASIHSGLRKLDELVTNINDIIENRIEKNLKIVSKTLLVDLPASESFSVDDFVKMQEKHIGKQSTLLQGKNLEIEFAVRDLIRTIQTYKLDPHVEPVSEEEIVKLKKHYNHFMYQALLHCAKNSMNALKKRIGSRVLEVSAGKTPGKKKQDDEKEVHPFFDVDINLATPQVVLNPSLDEVQECINKSAQAILRCFMSVQDWNNDPKVTFFDKVTKDIEIVRVALLLTGCIQGIRNTVQKYLNSFTNYNWLWREDKDLAFNKFMEMNPSLEDFEVKLRSFGDVDTEISAINDVENIGALSLRTVSIKNQLKAECNRWKIKFSDNLHAQAKSKLEILSEYIRTTNGKVSREVKDLDTLRFIMKLLSDVRERESSMEMEINPIMDMYRMLESYLPAGFMEKEEIDKKTVLRANWKKLLKLCEQRTDELSKAQTKFKRQLLKDIKDFKVDAHLFREDFLRNGPLVDGADPNTAVDRLQRFKEEFKIRQRKMESYRGGEELFAMPLTDYPEILATEKELKLADQLFTLYGEVLSTLEEWKGMKWTDFASNINEMGEVIEAFSGRCKKMPSRLREYTAYKTLKQQIEDFQTVLPLLQEFTKESIQPRHWEKVMEITGTEFDFQSPEFKLQSLLGIGLVDKKDEIEEITDGADKELKIEKNYTEIYERWKVAILAFKEWKGRNIQVLQGVVGIMEELEEAQMNLQAMLTSRNVGPFKEPIQELLTTLSETSDTLERWLKVQQMWCSLESVFMGGDIAKQMPMEAKKFAKIDKEWAKAMGNAYVTQIVVEAAANEVLRAGLPVMYAELEKCQKSLEGYLEQKRNKFPRFYFVSNPGLLVILSQGSDPLAMNEHYEKVFDAISTVEHNKKDKTIIEKMNGDGGGKGGEVIPFSSNVKAVGNIEEWLSDLLKKMQATMKDIARSCAGELHQVAVDLTNNLRGFVDGFISQFALLGIQMLWTTDVTTSLEQARQKRTSMKDCSARQKQILDILSSWCLQDLGSSVNRVKVETLVTIHLHQKDVASALVSRKVNDVNDFEWLKQARFYWRPAASDSVSPDGACIVAITDVDFEYQFEYLGAKERLVVTGLTDRCYITLAQALGMFFGGAPAGPAGTGKTETVKDLGRSLGIFVVVTNCTDQQSYLDCAKIFKGLCMGGLWGCFDEFNRIRLPVLSVVAQQVMSVLSAKKNGLAVFQFPGDPQMVNLIPCCGFFITMNPGYAGRQELPENLKALFRGVAMMIPDFEMIMKVKLCSVGYSEYDILSRKFFVLYNTAKEQLSAQKHYDWGLRNILAVLRTAGATKRSNLDKPEAYLMYRTLREMNLSKMVAQDVPLFISLLADLFPLITTPPAKAEYPEVDAALRAEVAKNKLEYYPTWVAKAMQLYDTVLVRHGIMLVGPTGGGKTQIFKNLRVALDTVTGTQHRDTRFNPKAIRAQEMYGELDPLSGEWTDGVFAMMWSKFNNKANAYNTWIIADGPVDAIWIEDLNTVLDDNKILTLANGSRMPMTPNVKMMFEVETLVNASPATVSRAGIIYVSDTELDWSPTTESWVKKQPDRQQDILRGLFTKYMGSSAPTNPGHLIDFLNRNTAQVMSVSRVGVTSALSDLFMGLTEGTDCIELGGDFEGKMEKIFLYCMSWSVGGLLEAEDRMKFDQFIREIDSTHMPNCQPGETIFEYFVSADTGDWQLWKPPVWNYPVGVEKLDFSNLLVPTMDSTRACYNCKHLHKRKRAICMVGGEGTAKTSTALMFFATLDPSQMLVKRVNFSSATTPAMCQATIEVELEKRGRNFGPPGGKAMTIFIDDMSMPEINTWGDQPTLEMVRLIVEYGGFCFLDKDKRGDFKVCEDLQYMAAMQHPGGGKNDIPNRLKRNFFIFNMVLPSITSINDMYGQMLSGRFPASKTPPETLAVVNKLTETTISLWKTIKDKILPTPAKFHYMFNLRELSRVFQGILLTPTYTVKDGGFRCEQKLEEFNGGGVTLLRIWKHECSRVFGDKLASLADKAIYNGFMDTQLMESFGPEMFELCKESMYMVNFLRPDVYDEDGVLIEEAPKVYEPGGNLEDVRPQVNEFLQKYNTDFPSKKMDLVLFNDALEHLLRINRLMEMPRGSGLLVGVGGSGKQSLVKLSSYISRATMFQITLTKQYNRNAFLEDMKFLYKSAGHLRKPTTFLFTESEIKDEVFLEFINSILLTGDIPGLFAKDEIMAITADLRNSFIKERAGAEETQDNLKQYFIDKVRDNLHLMICMSPMNPKFPIRARKFPGLISCPTIDWFLPWPADALVSLSQAFISNVQIECTKEVKENLMIHMGMVHSMVTSACEEYFISMRRRVFQTPKSYLSFIQNFIGLYSVKLGELKEKEARVTLGLQKLIQGAADVEEMKKVLAEEQIKLDVATTETNKMLESLEVSSAEAKRESEKVLTIKTKCLADASRIGDERTACMADLAKAQPFVDQAEDAINSIKPNDINEIKKLPNPPIIIQLVMDGVLALFKLKLDPVTPVQLILAKVEYNFIKPSFKPHGVSLLSQSDFLARMKEFGTNGKDLINDETIEFMNAYIDLEHFTPDVAKSASSAAKGLCSWVIAMRNYVEASKIVKPKLEALSIAEANLEAANKALAAAEGRLEACQARLNELQAMFDAQMAEKRRIEDGAEALKRKMTMASQLIGGLAGERTRWTDDKNNFVDLTRRLVGDCAAACAFVCYCGPFNQEFRKQLIEQRCMSDCVSRGVPITNNLDWGKSFMVDIGTIGDWNMQGLPADPLSIQNGILVTRSSRFPLMIDPQGQALNWIRNREASNMPMFGTTTLTDNKLKDKLEACMGEGQALIITGVEDEIDPMFDPVLEKQFLVKGKRKLVNVSDKLMDYDDKFMMYFITRLPNPNFSPELQAKTNVVDFTVTQKGLEEQLLGKVIGKEQKALEDQLNGVLEEVNMNTKALLELDRSLLERLTSNTGNLLEDEELIGVLANTKAKAAEVKQKLVAAEETTQSIAEKREQFRPVATRGSVLYFSIVEMSNVNAMYQTALSQFLLLFNDSMDKAEKATLTTKRVGNIIDTMTYIVYRYINRGLYERDKLTFVMIVTMKILITASLLKQSDLSLFLRGGAALDIKTVRQKPNWMTNDNWLNVIELSNQQQKFFGNLPNEIMANETMWRAWYEQTEGEIGNIPDYEQRIAELPKVGPYMKLLLVRALKLDRVMLMSKWFVRNTEEMGPTYVEPVTDTIESIYDGMVAITPVIFLLSIGADPTEAIENLARKRKLPSPATISMGEGQEPVAIKAMQAGAANGTWVLLQNCELGLELMATMEEFLEKLREGMDPNFRLFITALPDKNFPLGLLQMSTKVTNEPPAGLKAGVLKSYTTVVDQDRLERVDQGAQQWRKLLFALCFLHSIVQERRKFGSIGWGIPYEYNTGDLTACILFLEKHLYNGSISWPTLNFMVAEAQYGGKITDSSDRILFNAYTMTWLCSETCKDGFLFNPKTPYKPSGNNMFPYKAEGFDNIPAYQTYIKTFPEIDSPEIFGMNPNADITFREKEVRALLATLSETQPKGGGGGAGGGREEGVSNKAAELLRAMPEAYIEEEYKHKFGKLGGATMPMNIFLFQEIQRFQNVIAKVTFMLQQLILAIKGEVVMTEALQATLDSMADAGVPRMWVFTVAGDEFSWILPTLGLWFDSFRSRDDQYRNWLNVQRPPCFWLTGFFNPQGILTAMKQDVCKKKNQQGMKWALDEVTYKTEVMKEANMRNYPQEGLYIRDLHIEGAVWSKEESQLAEAEKQVNPMPILYVTAILKTDEKIGGMYLAPVYKYKNRTDRYLIFKVTLKTSQERNAIHWTLRGVALLCNDC